MRKFCDNKESRAIRRIDTDKTIEYRAAYALHYLRIMHQFDVDVFKEPNPLEYCYVMDENGYCIHMM